MNLESGVVEVFLDDIIPNRFQPRLSFDDKALNELSESIKQHGIIQPLVLRKIGDKYEIIAGERRYKASQMAGLSKVPAVIADIDDNTSAEVALVENIQRRNLTSIEEAKSYKNLLDKGYLTQDELAKKMGLSQSAVSNKLRLLNLDEEVQDALLNERISERHARALLQISDKEQQKIWLNRIINERMTVRQLDMELKNLKINTEDDGSEDIPLVNLTPNIEDIKTNAEDIHPIEPPKIMEEFFPQKKEESVENVSTDTQATTFPRKFFNFLEDEEANLSTEAPVQTNNFAPSNNISEPEITENNEVASESSIVNNAFEIEQPIFMENTAPISESTTSEIPQPTIESVATPISEPTSATFSGYNLFDNNNFSQSTPVINNVATEVPTIESNTNNITDDNFNTNSTVDILDMPNITNVRETEEVLDVKPTNIFTGFNPFYQPENDPVNQTTPILEPEVTPDSFTFDAPVIEQQTYNPNLNEPIEKEIEPVTPMNNIFEETKPQIEITDPISRIDALDPNYEQKIAEETGQDLKTAINMVRECTKDLERRNFNVETEEVDLEGKYQITITIEK